MRIGWQVRTDEQMASIRTLNRSDIVKRMSRRTSDLSRQDIDVAVRLIEMAMAQALSEGHAVIVRGFGRLTMKRTANHKLRNPKTGETVVTHRTYVLFKAYPPLLAGVNDPTRRMRLPGLRHVKRTPRYDAHCTLNTTRDSILNEATTEAHK
jgi:nucleoid DNA-binding protein